MTLGAFVIFFIVCLFFNVKSIKRIPNYIYLYTSIISYNSVPIC